MLIFEYRVILPMKVDEYQVAQLYSVAEASKNETGGGEGIEVLKNEPYSGDPLFDGQYDSGQYTHKIYHVASKVPAFIQWFAPKGSLVFHETAWNAYPYCKTVITNPDYMKDNFYISIETLHVQDKGGLDNAHKLSKEELKIREVVYIDIANDPVSSSDYKREWDPKLYKSAKTGRGPLGKDWQSHTEPIMCAYKLVRVHFKWFGLQNKVEKYTGKIYRRMFNNFHRQLFCSTDDWHGLTMEDIRRIEDKTKSELDEQRATGELRGTKGGDDDE